MKKIDKLADQYAEVNFDPFTKASGMLPSDIAKKAFKEGFKQARKLALEAYEKEYLDYTREGDLEDSPSCRWWAIDQLGEEE